MNLQCPFLDQSHKKFNGRLHVSVHVCVVLSNVCDALCLDVLAAIEIVLRRMFASTVLFVAPLDRK